MTADDPTEPPGPAMAQVPVTINGRHFRLLCEAGQETRLQRLANDLDLRIAGLRTEHGEIGDIRLTVTAALILSDELSEMGDKVRQLEQEIAALQDARVAASDHRRAAQAAVAAALDSAAERIEAIARRLNQPRARNGDGAASGVDAADAVDGSAASA